MRSSSHTRTNRGYEFDTRDSVTDDSFAFQRMSSPQDSSWSNLSPTYRSGYAQDYMHMHPGNYQTYLDGHTVRSTDPRRMIDESKRKRFSRGYDYTQGIPHIAQPRFHTYQQEQREADWNSSTRVKESAKLRHQLLDRTYDPRQTLVAKQANASDVAARLSKSTVASRSMRTKPAERPWKNATSPKALDPPPAPDNRARDAIEALKQYRKEVEKRMRTIAAESEISH